MDNLRMLIEKHNAYTNFVFNLEQLLKGSHKVKGEKIMRYAH